MDINFKEFELLLFQFCKQDIANNFIIEHDVKQIGAESENKRQIDVRIKGKIGISNMLICGEAKNWNEKVGSDVMDGIKGKYFTSEIKANKVILFSNLGYYKPAITTAKKLGVELLQPLVLGRPIKNVPYIISIGTLGQMVIEVIHEGPQSTFMNANAEEYVIFKGSEYITFYQMVYDSVVSSLRTLDLNLHIEVSKINISEANVLYELKSKPGYKYHATFNVEVSLKWVFVVDYMPCALLRHVNTGDDIQVNLQGEDFEIIDKVLLSEKKIYHHSRSECIDKESSKNDFYYTLIALQHPTKYKLTLI